MIATNTRWIDHLLRLNRHIVAAERALSVQAGRIIDALEMREDIAEKEETFVSYRSHLHCLRQMRDEMLSGTHAID
jgi:hypothetical protein